MEKKKLSIPSKIILIITLVLILVLVGLIVYFVVSKIINNKYKLVATTKEEIYGNECTLRIEFGFKNRKLYMNLTIKSNDKDAIELMKYALDKVEIESTKKGKKIVIEDIELIKMMFGNYSEYLQLFGLSEEDIQELFEKKYSEEEMEKFLIIMEYNARKNGFTIQGKGTKNLAKKYNQIMNDLMWDSIVETSKKAKEETDEMYETYKLLEEIEKNRNSSQNSSNLNFSSIESYNNEY